jgi:hypothetical protein
MSAETAHARAKVASLARCVKNGERKPNDPEYLEARRDLKAVKLESYIQKVVASAPPLSASQLARLSALFDVQPTTQTRKHGRRSA